MLVGLTELVVLTVGVVIALRQLTDLKESRQRENIFLRFESFGLSYNLAKFDFLSKEWGSTFEDFHTHSPESQIYYEFLQIIHNNLGIMLKEKMIEPDMLYRIYAPRSIMRIWEIIENIVNNYREIWNAPRFMEDFEYLYN